MVLVSPTQTGLILENKVTTEPLLSNSDRDDIPIFSVELAQCEEISEKFVSEDLQLLSGRGESECVPDLFSLQNILRYRSVF